MLPSSAVLQKKPYSGLLQAGGFVTDGRVNGSLNLSRALGDMEYKQSADLEAAEQIVTAVPEVRKCRFPASGLLSSIDIIL